MISAPYQPGGFDEFVRLVVPELQKRGLYRTRYEGATLRENLGLARPPAGAWQARVARRELKVPA